jgi:hypothetical protein
VPIANTYCYARSNGYTNRNANTDVYCNTQSEPDRNCNRNADAHKNSNRNSNRNLDADCHDYCNANSNTQTHLNAEASADTSPSPYSAMIPDSKRLRVSPTAKRNISQPKQPTKTTACLAIPQ